MNSNPLAKDFNTGSLLKFAFPTISMMLFMGKGQTTRLSLNPFLVHT